MLVAISYAETRSFLGGRLLSSIFIFQFCFFLGEGIGPPAENAELAEIFGMACWMSHSL